MFTSSLVKKAWYRGSISGRSMSDFELGPPLFRPPDWFSSFFLFSGGPLTRLPSLPPLTLTSFFPVACCGPV